MTRDEVLELIREHLAAELGVDASGIGEDTRFKEDLEADSLDLVEVVEIVEEELAPRARPGFHIEDEDLDGLRTVGEAVDLAVAHL